MSEKVVEETETLLDGVVQFRFADEENALKSVNAAEVAEVLQGVVEFTSDMAKQGLFGDGVPPEVRVRPPKEGSFVIETVISWTVENPEVALGIATTAGGAVVKAVDAGVKLLRGAKPTDFDYLANGNVKVVLDGVATEVPVGVWKRLDAMKRPTRKALRKLMAPLGDEATTLELRDATVTEDTEAIMSTPPAVVAGRSDYREAAAEVNESSEETETFTVEGVLQSIDFRKGEKWRVATPRGTRLATIEDKEFLAKLDRGEAIHKNDIFEVTIRETRVTNEGRTSISWALLDARLTKRGQDGDDSSDASQVGS